MEFAEFVHAEGQILSSPCKRLTLSQTMGVVPLGKKKKSALVAKVVSPFPAFSVPGLCSLLPGVVTRISS